MQGVIYLKYTKILVANTGEDTLSLCNINDYSIKEKIHLKRLIKKDGKIGPSHMDIGKDGSLYIVNSYDDSLAKIDLENVELLDLIQVGRYPTCIKIFKEKIYVLNSESNSISIIDENKFTLIEDIFLGEGPLDIEIYLEKLKILIANTNSNNINILDLERDDISHIRLDRDPIKIIIEKNRLFILSYVNNGFINYSDLSELEIDSEKTIMSIRLKGIFTDLIKIKDKEIFYMLNIDDGYLYRISLEEELNIIKTYLGGMPSNIIWDGKDRLYITNSLSDLLTIVDENNQKIVSNIRVGKEPNRVLLL